MNTKAKKLDELHLEYEALLVEEIENLLGLGMAHGWKSKNVENGIKMRAKLVKAGSKIKLPISEQS